MVGFIPNCKTGIPWPKIPKLSKVIKTTGDMMDAIGSGEIDVPDAYDQGVREIEDAVWGG